MTGFVAAKGIEMIRPDLTLEETNALLSLVAAAQDGVAPGRDTREIAAVAAGKLVAARGEVDGFLPDGRVDFSDSGKPEEGGEDFDFSGLGREIDPAHQRIDFSDVAQPDGSFEFILPALLLPDKPPLLTAQINGVALSDSVKAYVLWVFRMLWDNDPNMAARAKRVYGTTGWTETRAVLENDVVVQRIVRAACDLMASHLSANLTNACNLTLGYSMVWALVPTLDKTTRGDFRASMIKGALQSSFEGLDAMVESIRADVKRILGARSIGRVKDMTPEELEQTVKTAARDIMREALSSDPPGLKNVADRLHISLGALSKRLSSKRGGVGWRTICAELRKDGENNMSNLMS